MSGENVRGDLNVQVSGADLACPPDEKLVVKGAWLVALCAVDLQYVVG